MYERIESHQMNASGSNGWNSFCAVSLALPIVRVHQPYNKERRTLLQPFNRRQITLNGTIRIVVIWCLVISWHSVYLLLASAQKMTLCKNESVVWFPKHQCKYGKFIAFPLHSTGGNLCWERTSVIKFHYIFCEFNRIQCHSNQTLQIFTHFNFITFHEKYIEC